MHVPCGCASRKQIMFTQGNLTAREACLPVVLGAVLLLVTKVR